MNKAQNNLEVLCGNLMDASCYYTEKGQLEVADAFHNLVDALIEKAGYNYQLFIHTGKLVTN